MFLFILESIGTSELFLIGVIALIFLGPRKLPQMARTIGKYMAEFRRTTSEFKSTWEKEVDFAIEEENIRKQSGEMAAPQVERVNEISAAGESRPDAPSIRQIDSSAFNGLPVKDEIVGAKTAAPGAEEPKAGGKQDWL